MHATSPHWVKAIWGREQVREQGPARVQRDRQARVQVHSPRPHHQQPLHRSHRHKPTGSHGGRTVSNGRGGCGGGRKDYIWGRRPASGRKPVEHRPASARIRAPEHRQVPEHIPMRNICGGSRHHSRRAAARDFAWCLLKVRRTVGDLLCLHARASSPQKSPRISQIRGLIMIGMKLMSRIIALFAENIYESVEM